MSEELIAFRVASTPSLKQLLLHAVSVQACAPSRCKRRRMEFEREAIARQTPPSRQTRIFSVKVGVEALHTNTAAQNCNSAKVGRIREV